MCEGVRSEFVSILKIFASQLKLRTRHIFMLFALFLPIHVAVALTMNGAGQYNVGVEGGGAYRLRFVSHCVVLLVEQRLPVRLHSACRARVLFSRLSIFFQSCCLYVYLVLESLSALHSSCTFQRGTTSCCAFVSGSCGACERYPFLLNIHSLCFCFCGVSDRHQASATQGRLCFFWCCVIVVAVFLA